MEASSSDTWLNNSLICPNSQPDLPHHAYSLYPSDLLPLHPPGHLGHLMGENEPGDCDAFCQPFHQNLGPELHRSSQLHHQELSCFVESQPLPYVNDHSGNQSGKVAELADPTSARKVQKADREKLRRDRLNEQFMELANALDSDRPKNDKATILGDCIQVLTELRAQVKRLKVDHSALLDESRELTNEKSELREEKTALKNETEQLQCQLQQRVRMLLSWTGMDPSLMVGTPSFPYPLPVPSAASAPATSQQASGQTQLQPPILATGPYVPYAAAHGAFAMHPGLPAYTMFGSRPGTGNMPFFPYPPYPVAPIPVGSHSHVERPFAQYPSPLHPVPGYAVQTQPQQASRPLTSTEQPAQMASTSCPLTVLSTSSSEEQVPEVNEQDNVGHVSGGIQQVQEEEEQATAPLLPDSRCQSDTLPLTSADGLTQPVHTDLQLQSSIRAHAIKDMGASFLEVKKETIEIDVMPSITSFSQLQRAAPSSANKHKTPFSQPGEQIIQGDTYSLQCQEPDADSQYDQLMRPPAA